jgi:hypothetical protein
MCNGLICGSLAECPNSVKGIQRGIDGENATEEQKKIRLTEALLLANLGFSTMTDRFDGIEPAYRKRANGYSGHQTRKRDGQISLDGSLKGQEYTGSVGSQPLENQPL